VWIFVNSFSFIFLEFLAKFYRASHFSWAKMRNKGGTGKMGPARPAEQGGTAAPVPPAQGGPAAVRPSFSLEHAFFTSFFGQKILREV
jgi:hypothetical protein